LKRPLVNLLSLLSGDLGSRFIGFFVSAYLARVLEPTGFGLVSLGLAVLGYLQLASSPGIQILETRNAAAFADVDRERVSAVLSLRLILAAVLWITAAGLAYVFVSDNGSRGVILLFALSVFPYALMLDWFFQGKEAFFAVGTSRLVQYLVYGIIVFFAVHSANDVKIAAIAFGVGALASVTVLWNAYRRRWGTMKFHWSPALWRDIFVKGLPVGGAMFLAQSVTNLPPLAIGVFSSAADVGLFSSAMKVVFLLLLVDRLFNALFLPVITRYISAQADEVGRLVQTTVKVLLALIVPIAIGGAIMGGDIVAIAFGGSYEEAVPLLEILIGYFALTVLNSVFVCVLIGSGREKTYTRMATWGSLSLCIAVVAGTAMFGVHGAAYAVVFGELVTVTLMAGEARKVVAVSLTTTLGRPLVAGACMIGTALFFREMNSLALTAISVLAFGVVMVLLKGLSAGELRFLREKFV